MDELLPVEPVRPPGPARRRLVLVITLVLLVAFVVVAGLEGNGFILRAEPGPTFNGAIPVHGAARLAYVGNDGSLNVMDAARNKFIHYASSGVSYQFPAWSPDATRLAVIRTADAETSLATFVPEPGGGTRTDLTPPTVIYHSADEPPFYVYWATDGQSIAFLTTEPDGLALRPAPVG